MLSELKCSIFLLYLGCQLCYGAPSMLDPVQRPFGDGVAIASQRKALKEAEVIPDVLDDFEPSVSVSISYPSKHKAVNLGNSIKPKHVTSQPVFSIYASEATPTATQKSNATYVLALTDPDATSPSDPVKAQMCHWVATNITVPLSSSVSLDPIEVFSLSAFSKGSAGSGIQELMPYVPPTPPPKTGDHRYVFVVLTPKSDVNHEQLVKPKDRPHWGYGHVGDGVREWAKENHLTVVGANFFYSKNKKQ